MTENKAVPEALETPAGRLGRIRRVRNDSLRDVPMLDLASEVLARIQEGNGFLGHPDLIRVGNDLDILLDQHLDMHENRYSRQRYADLYQSLYHWVEPVKPPLAGTTWVDLGCGSVNPGGMLFMFLMLGVERGYCIDLDDVQDVPRAVRALADCAALMLVDPRCLVGDHPITREEVLRNIASFDLRKLRVGDVGGVDEGRLSFLRESVHSLPLESGSVDVTTSVAFLEHLPRMDDVAEELARITRPGGMGIHVIDGTDHHRYGQEGIHPLGFLAVEPGAEMVHESNRLRPVEFLPLFERHGFEVLSLAPYETAPVDEELRQTFVDPWRSMSLDDLRLSQARIVIRKK